MKGKDEICLIGFKQETGGLDIRMQIVLDNILFVFNFLKIFVQWES